MWSPEQALEMENDIGGGNGEPRSAAGVTPLTPGAPGSPQELHHGYRHGDAQGSCTEGAPTPFCEPPVNLKPSPNNELFKKGGRPT